MKLIIKEELWEIDFRTGKLKIQKSEKQKVPCFVGKVIAFEK